MRNDVHPPYPTFHSDPLAPQGLSYNYMSSRYNDFPTNVVRGQDAFLGGHIGMDEDIHMDVDDTFGGPSAPPPHLRHDHHDHHDHGLYADSTRWMDPAEPLPSSFPDILPQDEHHHHHQEEEHAEAPTTVSMDAVYAGAGNGTIDPSLLAPATPPRLRSPSPLPTPPSVPSAPRADVDVGAAEFAPPPRRPRGRPKGSGAGRGRGKGKGKERAADVGYLAREQGTAMSSSLTPMSPVGEVASGKRARKPSTRVLESAVFDDVFDEEFDVGKSAGSGVGKRAKVSDEIAEESPGEDDEDDEADGPSMLSKSKIKKLAQEIPYCHQCRGQNKYDKMRCSVLKEGGVPCGLHYCEKCVRMR